MACRSEPQVGDNNPEGFASLAMSMAIVPNDDMVQEDFVVCCRRADARDYIHVRCFPLTQPNPNCSESGQDDLGEVSPYEQHDIVAPGAGVV